MFGSHNIFRDRAYTMQNCLIVHDKCLYLKHWYWTGIASKYFSKKLLLNWNHYFSKKNTALFVQSLELCVILLTPQMISNSDDTLCCCLFPKGRKRTIESDQKKSGYQFSYLNQSALHERTWKDLAFLEVRQLAYLILLPDDASLHFFPIRLHVKKTAFD